ETALNIAFSCKLISFDQQLITINAKSQDVVESLIKTLLKDLTSHGPFQDGCSSTHGATSETHKTKAKSKHKPSADVALVIDGKSLSYAMHKSIVKEFLKLSSLCSSVLICRATPGQKAQVVRVVRDQLNMLTLAIGDGANDVSMIQTANIGIGISGQEGKQAVMASDFAMAKFRFLERLLLVHGHWCYDRLARITLHMFYKSTVLIFLLFWYQMFNGFSGSVLIDQYVLMLFNVAFTAPPPFVIGIFDRDLPAATLLAKPRLYKQGPRGQMYKPYSFFIQISDAVYQSLAMFFVPYMAYHGSSVGIWEFGSTVATAS
ncbi:probable phospholipid-transporting ATPase VA, partial [Lingula anatina]|uniref:Probable phospholipid-transporting ATPase VA n=1 Tax=Lingula anatina TaxID=7574 RepID=A0A2R2MNM9_LINAN